jgi:hypothetical protein
MKWRPIFTLTRFHQFSLDDVMQIVQDEPGLFVCGGSLVFLDFD